MCTWDWKCLEFHYKRMIIAEDRSTVFDSKYFGLDVIYGRIFSLPKQFCNDCRHAHLMVFGRVRMAGPQNPKNSHLAAGFRLAELVVRWAEVTEVVLDNNLAEHVSDLKITMSVPPAHPDASNNFRHKNWLNCMHNTSRLQGIYQELQITSRRNDWSFFEGLGLPG